MKFNWQVKTCVFISLWEILVNRWHLSCIKLSFWFLFCFGFYFEIFQKFSLALTKGQIGETQIFIPHTVYRIFSCTTSWPKEMIAGAACVPKARGSCWRWPQKDPGSPSLPTSVQLLEYWLEHKQWLLNVICQGQQGLASSVLPQPTARHFSNHFGKKMKLKVSVRTAVKSNKAF